MIAFGQKTIEIACVPEQVRDIVKAVSGNGLTLLKSKDGAIYCTSFRKHRAVAILNWYDEGAIRYLPLLNRLGVLPTGFTVKEARVWCAEEARVRFNTHNISEVISLCKKLGVKAPKFPKSLTTNCYEQSSKPQAKHDKHSVKQRGRS